MSFFIYLFLHRFTPLLFPPLSSLPPITITLFPPSESKPATMENSQTSESQLPNSGNPNKGDLKRTRSGEKKTDETLHNSRYGHESYEAVLARREAAIILDNPELLMMHAQSRNEVRTVHDTLTFSSVSLDDYTLSSIPQLLPLSISSHIPSKFTSQII